MTRKELENGRCIGCGVYGYKKSYCNQMSYCDKCDIIVQIGCRIIRKIEKMQEKRILRICK